MEAMKNMLFAAVCGLFILATGCVDTVNDRTKAGVPFVKDRVEGQYERSVDQVFDAAKAVVTQMGALVNESTLYNQNVPVKTIQGKINQRDVWIRVEPVDPKPVSRVIVQARTSAGGVDVDLAHEIEKQVAVQLATR
jgi:hypothetical protein